MSETALKPVGETARTPNGELDVGEDLGFQRRWWRFERVAWMAFAAIVLLDVLGAFGRGYLANARRLAADGAVEIRYERIERTGAPSTLRLRFDARAIRGDRVRVFVTDALVRELGAQRIVPQPESTTIGEGGFTYAFPASVAPAEIAFVLQPAAPGVFDVGIRPEGAERVDLRIAVVP